MKRNKHKERKFWGNWKNAYTKLTENVPVWYEGCEDKYLQLLEKKLEIDSQIEDLREEISSHMKEDGVRRISTSKTNVCIVAEGRGCRMDAKGLRYAYPQIYGRYAVPFKIKEHLQIMVK